MPHLAFEATGPPQTTSVPFSTFLAPNWAAESLETPLHLPWQWIMKLLVIFHQFGLPDSLPKAALFLCGNRTQLPNVDTISFFFCFLFLKWFSSLTGFCVSSLDIYVGLPFNHFNSFCIHLNQCSICGGGGGGWGALLEEENSRIIFNFPKIMHERF